MTGCIYGLSFNGELRYVGKTILPRVRPFIHWKASRAKNSDGTWKYTAYLHNWCRTLPRIYDVVIIESCEQHVLSEREMFWIQKLKAEGFRLTNMTKGGDGGWPAGKLHPHAGKPGTFRGKKWNETTMRAHSTEVVCLTDGLYFPRVKDAAKHYNICIRNVILSCQGKRPTVNGGLRFSYF